MARPSNAIIVADVPFAIDWPTYNFRDSDPGFNAYTQGCTPHSGGQCGPGGLPFAPAKGIRKVDRWRPRRVGERSLRATQAIVRQFVVHLDGCKDARMCFNVLHNERGLSCHFLIDNDGTIYQTLDLADCAYHAAGLNETSIGVELANRGDAGKDPSYYDRYGMKRDLVACRIHGEKYVAFDYTPQQYLAMEHLGRVLAKALPNIKLDYPQIPGAPGNPLWSVLGPGEANGALLQRTYSGYLGHYHLTTRKWDPGPFDFKKFIGKIRGRWSFPIGLHSLAQKTEMPAEPSELDSAAQSFYDNNELEGNGGFFPVGPLEGYRLWHGGIHLHGVEGDKVVAPLQGYVIAARNGPRLDEIGSANFVLLKHSMKVGAEQVEFYSLYFHLKEIDAATPKDRRPKWMSSESWDDEPGRLVIFQSPEPVQAGDRLGLMGVAGPESESQLHFEVFTIDHGPIERLDPEKYWTLVYGGADRRFCKQKEILSRIDRRKKDGLVDREELFEFFREDPDRDLMRRVVSYHVSEWTDSPPWLEDLREAGEYKKIRPKRLEQMVDRQIIPTIWWTNATSQRLNLPADGMVYTYHPISFLIWLNKKANASRGAEGASGITKATAEDFRTQSTKKAMLDIDDTEGSSFIEADDLKADSEIRKLNLQDLVDGYGD